MNAELIEKIERYLADEMEPQERQDFELQLQTNEELKNTMQLYNSINTTMKEEDVSAGEKELSQTLEQMNRRYILTGGKIRKLSFKKLLAAAAALLVLVFSIVYYINSGKLTPEKLYIAYAEHSSLQVQLRGTAADSLAETAALKFNKKNYYEALPLLQEYLRHEPEDIQMKFSLATCYLELDKYSDAEKIFSEIAAGQSAYTASAGWYLALTSLKQKDIKTCRSRLQSIPQSSSYYARATELLRKLPD